MNFDDTKEIQVVLHQKTFLYIENYHFINAKAKHILESVLEWSQQATNMKFHVVATSSEADQHKMKHLPLLSGLKFAPLSRCHYHNR